MSEKAYVSELPTCDFCDKEAQYDGKTVMGPWGNMCTLHFGQYGTGLGTGRGQELAVRPVTLVEVEPGRFDQPKDFDKWMKQVDRYVQGQVGLSCYDLPDVCYFDWHADGMSAKAAASQLVSESMSEMGFDW